MLKESMSITNIRQKIITFYLFFREIFWEYPMLYSKNYYLHNFFSDLWIKKTFKNSNIVKYCYTEHIKFSSEKVSIFDVTVDEINYKNSLEILEKYGILIINNVLTKEELSQLKSKLNFESASGVLHFQRTINTSSEVNFKNISEFPSLLKITKFLQNNFYGCSYSLPKKIDFIKTKCWSLPEVLNRGETDPHIDKYIPA